MSPELRARRLTLRPLREEDSQALWSSIEASRPALKRRMRWVDGVRRQEDCVAFILGRKRQPASGNAEFGVFEARSERHAGIAALQGLAEDGQVAEFSIWIRCDLRGKGYATEAGRTLIAHAFKRASLRRLYVRLEPSNRDGRRIVQKLGFRYEGCLRHEKRLNGRWIDQECWGLLKDEWKK